MKSRQQRRRRGRAAQSQRSRRSRWTRRRSARSAIGWSTSSPSSSSRCRSGPVTRDESPVGRARCARLDGAAAGARHRPGRAARADRAAAVRPLAVQRAPAILRLHHRAAGADRDPRRFSRGGGQPERRRLDRSSPAATEIESQTVRWIAELIGYPTECGGLLVSGGNMANFVCFLAARAAKAGWDIREHGVAGGRRAGCACTRSAETHTWIQKAADIAGLGTAAIRWIPTDARSADGRRRAAPRRSRRTRPRATCRSWSSARRDRSAPARSIRCATSPPCAGSTASGSTSTAPTAASPPRCPKRPPICAASATPTRWRSIRTSGSMRRSRPAARWCAMPERLRAAFAYHPPYYHFEEQRDQLRRLRSAELARLPRAEGLAGAAPRRRRRLPSDDRRRHPPVARDGRGRAPHAGTAAASRRS